MFSAFSSFLFSFFFLLPLSRISVNTSYFVGVLVGGNPQPETVRAGLELVAFKQPHKLGWGPGRQDQTQLHLLQTSF